MEPKYEVVYGEDANLNFYAKDKYGLYMIEIDEGLSGNIASILLTEEQYIYLIAMLEKEKGNTRWRI